MTKKVSTSSVEWCFITRYGRKVDFFSVECRKILFFKSFLFGMTFKGEEGIDELKEDLNPCQIMYGIIRVKDPKTSLPKYVLLHWQGEGVQTFRKGQATTHFPDIEKYFSGVHVKFNVRTEDEVDESAILDKVSRVE